MGQGNADFGSLICGQTHTTDFNVGALIRPINIMSSCGSFRRSNSRPYKRPTSKLRCLHPTPLFLIPLHRDHPTVEQKLVHLGLPPVLRPVQWGMAIARAKGKLRGKQPKLSDRQQRELCRMHATGEYSISDLPEIFSVSRPTVYRTLNRSHSP